MALQKKPKLLYEITIKRKPYFRRFTLALVVALMALLALIALNLIRDQNGADEGVLLVGIVVAALAAVIFAVRALFSLIRWMRYRNETLRLFNQGILWTRSGKDSKYGWSSLKTYREGGHGIYLRGKPLLQWGAHKITMQDGRVLKIDSRYGDMQKLNQILSRAAAHVTGMEMGKALREEQPVKLHSRLTIWPGGIEIGKTEIPWSELDVKLKGTRLTIYRKNKSGKFAKVRQFDTRSVDNVAGFMDIATSTIRNHQRERFGV